MEIVVAIITGLFSICVAIFGSVFININNAKLQTHKLKEEHYVRYLEAVHNFAEDNKSIQALKSYILHRDMKLVIYARYSSHSQTEQSIEGQLQTCYEYAKNNGYTVIGEYIDRAQSGTTDNRIEFQRMIADSDRHTFDGVLVYQLDRFARNRFDSAVNKAKLKKNGVRVLSARENITDDASGILVEGILESMAEYYSAELSQKIRRGMDINAEKCLSNGSNPGLGYSVDSERRFHVNPETAPIVREIFEQYASGKTVTEIITDLNVRQIKTSLGKAFNKNSLHRLLRNKRYIGIISTKIPKLPVGCHESLMMNSLNGYSVRLTAIRKLLPVNEARTNICSLLSCSVATARK